MNTYQTKVAELKNKLEEVNIYIKDKDVVKVLEIARTIYARKLDIMHGDELMQLGGELSGLYFSFGNKCSQARADHEISENMYKQILSNLQLTYLDEDTKYKVTEAKSLASRDMQENQGDVIIKEALYKQWENVMETTKTLIMFIQSALATKKSMAFINKDLQDNG